MSDDDATRELDYRPVNREEFVALLKRVEKHDEEISELKRADALANLNIGRLADSMTFYGGVLEAINAKLDRFASALKVDVSDIPKQGKVTKMKPRGSR